MLGHALPSAHLTEFEDFASRGMFCPSWSACGAGVRAPRLRPYLRLHLLRPCQHQTINSSHSSQTSFRSKLAAPARTLFITLLFCGTTRTVVYRVLCGGSSCPPDSFSSSEPRPGRETSWTIKGSDTVSRSAAENFAMVSTFDL